MGRGSWVVGRGSWVVGRGSWVVGRGSWVVGRGSWVVGARSPMWTRHACIQHTSRNSGFVRDLFLACTLSES